jgi:hypothetical protein
MTRCGTSLNAGYVNDNTRPFIHSAAGAGRSAASTAGER